MRANGRNAASGARFYFRRNVLARPGGEEGEGSSLPPGSAAGGASMPAEAADIAELTL